MRDWHLFSPPVEFPEEEDTDLEEIFDRAFPYKIQDPHQVKKGAEDPL